MAWSLLEAGRLWKKRAEGGHGVAKRIAREDVILPGLGSMLLRQKSAAGRIAAF